MKHVLVTGLIITVLFACKQEEKQTETVVVPQAESIKYTPDMVVNEKDYACGMPVKAGISDTCHVDGKAYGFCSTECKAEFLKDPKKYLATK